MSITTYIENTWWDNPSLEILITYTRLIEIWLLTFIKLTILERTWLLLEQEMWIMINLLNSVKSILTQYPKKQPRNWIILRNQSTTQVLCSLETMKWSILMLEYSTMLLIGNIQTSIHSFYFREYLEVIQ
jgi:hypothetical protein